MEEKKARSGLHYLNTADKINYASLTVQRRRMDVEVKQTKLLSFATQDNALKSQIDSARELAKIVCPVFDESNERWKHVLHLMDEQRALTQQIAGLTEELNFGVDDDSEVAFDMAGKNESAKLAANVPVEIDFETSSTSLPSSSSLAETPKKGKRYPV